MNLNTANLAIKVSVEKANDIGGKFCVAVMDAGVNLVAFGRMDGGRVGTIDVAMKKGSKIQYFLPCILIICRVASVHIHTHNNGRLFTFVFSGQDCGPV